MKLTYALPMQNFCCRKHRQSRLRARSHFIKVIENRINGLGISQPVVQIQGKNKTLVKCIEAEQRHRYH